MEDGKIQVTLGDGSVHEMEARDVDVFTKFIEREKINSDGNEERDRLLMDSIDPIQLAYKSDQQKLLDLCRKAQGVERCGTGSAF
uniref:Uncharacterized protein n=1 Tax=Oryza punctata TaxID=4537 RepID=A0A0E0MP01_ORYPU